MNLSLTVMICVILVNIQTHKHTNRQLLTGYTISSASGAKTFWSE